MIRQSRNKPQAWEVIKALTCDEAQIKMAESGLAQPAKMSLARSEHFFGSKGQPLHKQFLDKAVKSIVYEPFLTDWMEINGTYIQPNFDLYFRNQLTLEQALQKIDEGLRKGKFSIR